MPAMFINNSVARWLVLPGPADENTSASGLAFASAINSFTERGPSDGATTSSAGELTVVVTPAKSFSVS